MIQVTNNAGNFFDESGAPIYIYGAGNPGRWVAEYMERCHMEYAGFIDRAVGLAEDCFLRGKKIISPERLNKLEGKRIRIIVAIGKPQEALLKLQWQAHNREIFCLYPVYKDGYWSGEKYDINRLLGYFRRKLLYVELPTILSNNCNAGLIYRALGEFAMKTPTSNTAICPKDFLKICKNPHNYLDEDMVFSHWTVSYGVRCPVGKIKDIEVVFAHSDKPEEAVRGWNKLRKWVKFENMVYIFTDEWGVIPYQIAQEFCNLPVKHLLMLNNSLYTGIATGGVIHLNKNSFINLDNAIENWFDLLGWMNGEFEI